MTRNLFDKLVGAEVSEYLLEETDKAQRKLLSAIAARCGLDRTSESIGLSASHVRQALDGREGRNLDSRHRRGILRLATEQERTKYYELEMSPFGRVPAAISPRTAEQRLSDLEFRVAAMFGAAGAELVEKERAKP